MGVVVLLAGVVLLGAAFHWLVMLRWSWLDRTVTRAFGDQWERWHSVPYVGKTIRPTKKDDFVRWNRAFTSLTLGLLVFLAIGSVVALVWRALGLGS